jgi:hypothetical protein
MTAIFSIVTKSHIPNALGTMQSYKRYHNSENTKYMVFVIDDDFFINTEIDNILVISLKFINLHDHDLLHKRIISNNKEDNHCLDRLRWALKPCIIDFLLSVQNYQQCIFLDSDLYFINSIDHLIKETPNVLLSPHFRPYATTNIFPWWKENDDIGDTNVFTDGYFNGGFCVFNNTKISLNAIDWWKRCCLNKCIINKSIGLYVDQKYLDFLYMHFNGISKIHDRGCNIAVWNIYTYYISNIDYENNTFLINNHFTPKFFHFSGDFLNNNIMNFYNKKFMQDVEKYRDIVKT